MLLPRSPREFCWLSPAVPPPPPRRRRSPSTRPLPRTATSPLRRTSTSATMTARPTLTKSGDIKVRCSNGTPYTVKLSTGGGTYAQRLLSKGTDNAAVQPVHRRRPLERLGRRHGLRRRSTAARAAACQSSQEKTHTVYGQLPNSTANQDAPVGSYADTITVTSNTESATCACESSCHPGGRRRVDRGDGCHGRHVHDLATAGRFRRPDDHRRPYRPQRRRDGRGRAGPGNGLVTGRRAGRPRAVP